MLSVSSSTKPAPDSILLPVFCPLNCSPASRIGTGAAATKFEESEEHSHAQFSEMQRHWQRLQSMMVVEGQTGIPDYVTHEIFETFLQTSQLPQEVCVEIAAKSNTHSFKNGIGEDDFSVSCQLVALAQAGLDPSLDNLDVVVPLARFVTTPFDPTAQRHSFV